MGARSREVCLFYKSEDLCPSLHTKSQKLSGNEALLRFGSLNSCDTGLQWVPPSLAFYVGAKNVNSPRGCAVCFTD